MHQFEININADIGEMAGQDEAIMPYLSSCNIATGGHVGDAQTIQKTIDLAIKNKVEIGAHPSYPDRENFGRIRSEISDSELTESLIEQLQTFYKIAQKNKVEVHHIKPHGALYHDLVNDKEKAILFLSVVEKLGIKTQLYTLQNGFLHQLSGKNHTVCFETFIDRHYNTDLSLVSRKESHALIEEPKEVWEQLYEMVFLKQVTTVSGKTQSLSAETFCIHGDHPNATEILKYIHSQVEQLKS